MSKQITWLWKESENWVRKGLISPDQASSIRDCYPKPGTPLPWGTLIFSGFGAVIAGLGIILLLAYNWQEISRHTKLAVILAGVAALHALGGWLYTRSDWRKPVGDAISLLGTMLFGAGIWLVAQVYHIEEHFPNGFLIWGLGALIMAWAMASLSQGLAASVLLCIWGCSEGWGFDFSTPWPPLLILAGIGPLAWRLRSPLLLLILLSSALITLLAAVTAMRHSLPIVVMISMCTATAGGGILLQGNQRFPKANWPMGLVGWAGSLLCFYLLSFPDLADDLLRVRSSLPPQHFVAAELYRWGSFVIAATVWVGIGWRLMKGNLYIKGALHFEDWLLPGGAAMALFSCLNTFRGLEIFIAGAFNLVLLAIVASWMARGIREGLVRSMVLGSALLVALVFARYFDLFDSLAVRGAVFLCVGAVLFAQGVLFRRTRKRLKTMEEEP